jgi:predicted 3-demethylubiquinone-9 3-methyltransferase (glyoxalase superfamily)
VSWQIVPTVLQELIIDPNHAKSERVFAALLQMKKLVIADLERAAGG